MPSSLALGNRHIAITWFNGAAAYAIDRAIFTAPYSCTLQSASFVSSVVGSDGGAVNLQLTKESGTTAPGAGTDLLANNTNAGFNLKGAINTVQHASFKAGSSRKFVKGDRLSLDFAGTQTAVEGVLVTAIFNRTD